MEEEEEESEQAEEKDQDVDNELDDDTGGTYYEDTRVSIMKMVTMTWTIKVMTNDMKSPFWLPTVFKVS